MRQIVLNYARCICKQDVTDINGFRYTKVYGNLQYNIQPFPNKLGASKFGNFNSFLYELTFETPVNFLFKLFILFSFILIFIFALIPQ